MNTQLKEILLKRNFKTFRECNQFLLDAGYSIDEVIVITDELFDINQLEDTKSSIAFKKLSILIPILNEGWKPNWDDENEKKWFPYFDMRNGQVSFSYAYCNWNITDNGVFSPLCYKRKELAEYGAKKYIELYKDLIK